MQKFSSFGPAFKAEEQQYLKKLEEKGEPEQLPSSPLTGWNLLHRSAKMGAARPLTALQLMENPFLYESFTDAQKKWYFFWKREVQSGEYPPTNLESFLVLLYEYLSGELLPAEQVIGQIERLLDAYPDFRSASQGRMIYWATLFSWSYHVPFPSLKGLTRDEMETREVLFRINLGLDQNRLIHPLNITWQELCVLSDYNFLAGPVFGWENGSKDKEYLCSLFSWVDYQLYRQSGRGFLETFGPSLQAEYGLMTKVNPVAALQPGFHIRVRRYTSSQRFRKMVTDVIREAENQIRIQQHVRGRLKGIQLDEGLRQWVDEFVRKSIDPFWNPWQAQQDHVQGQTDHCRSAAALPAQGQREHRSASNKRRENSAKPGRGEDREINWKQEISSRNLNYNQINLLRQESDEVREVLRVEEETVPCVPGSYSSAKMQSTYSQQIAKFVRSLQPAEVKFLLRLQDSQNKLPVSANRLDIMKGINELSDIYLKRSILETKGKKIYLLRFGETDIQYVLEAFPQIAARLKNKSQNTKKKKHSSSFPETDTCFDQNNIREPELQAEKTLDLTDTSEQNAENQSRNKSSEENKGASGKNIETTGRFQPSKSKVRSSGRETRVSHIGGLKPPTHYLEHQEAWEAFWDSLEPVYQETMGLLVEYSSAQGRRKKDDGLPLPQKHQSFVSNMQSACKGNPNHPDHAQERLFVKEQCSVQEALPGLSTMSYDEIQEKLTQLAEQAFLMADALVDEINFQFELQMNDLLIDGKTLMIDKSYWESADFLFRRKKKDYHG